LTPVDFPTQAPGLADAVSAAEARVVLVTGASRGIGRAVARRFAMGGASVVVHYGSNTSAAASVLAELGVGEHLIARADLADPADVLSLVERVIERFGGVDVLVNNAGIYEPHPVLTTTAEEWRASWQRTISTNLLGPANLIHAVVPVMIERGGGRILNVK
jgi:NAD(P)-dependent dehydrogenase (short-subunit alcohol dehydrogenase family)